MIDYLNPPQVWSAVFFTVVVMSVLLFSFETSMHFREYYSWVQQLAAGYNLSLSDFLSGATIEDEYSMSAPYPWLEHSQYAIFVFFLLEFTVRLATCPCKLLFVKQDRN